MPALLQPALLPFSAALGLLVVLVVLLATGLDGDWPEGGSGGLGAALDWLNAGRLPPLVLAIVFLALFACAGFALQFGSASLAGPLPWPAAAGLAAVLALPAARWLSRPLARVLPLDETTAVDIDSLVGRRARIVLGSARSGHAARAEVVDAHGQRHFVMVEPAGDAELTAANLLLLVGRNGPHFRAVAIPDDLFSELKV